jgi:3-deoxy-D-manno-octulosonic-acid transferase
MRIVLNLAYLLLIAAASPWLIYAALRHGKYREGFAEKFFGCVPRRAGKRPCVWLHAVSVGEVNLLAPMLRGIRRRHPDCECVISTTTKTGMAVAKKKYAEHLVFYCPLDFSWAVRRALRRIRPSALLLAELELWPNLIHASKREGACVALFNGRLSEKSFRGYRRVRWLVGRLLRQIDLIAVQNQQYHDRFLALGARADRVRITGSLKYDGAETDRKNPKTQELAALAGFDGDDVVFLAGSTQEPEEQLVLEAFRQLAAEHPSLRLILVPRHPERFEDVARLLDTSGVAWQRRSRLSSIENTVRRASSPSKEAFPSSDGLEAHRTAQIATPRVLLVDTVGELGAWWGTAQIAFVGGSMGDRGGQNMIEPAAYGASVCFGPNTHNFREVVDNLMHIGAAVVVRDQEELTQFVRRSLESPAFAANLGDRARQFVWSQLGATDRTLAAIEESCTLARPATAGGTSSCTIPSAA